MRARPRCDEGLLHLNHRHPSTSSVSGRDHLPGAMSHKLPPTCSAVRNTYVIHSATFPSSRIMGFWDFPPSSPPPNPSCKYRFPEGEVSSQAGKSRGEEGLLHSWHLRVRDHIEIPGGSSTPRVFLMGGGRGVACDDGGCWPPSGPVPPFSDSALAFEQEWLFLDLESSINRTLSLGANRGPLLQSPFAKHRGWAERLRRLP